MGNTKSIKLNVGASPIWHKEGWVILDHKAKENTESVIRGDAKNIHLPDQSVSVLFCSHMLEHVPHYRIQQVLLEFSRVLEVGGTLRLLTPDLEKVAKAYVNKDDAFFKVAKEEDESIRQDLGYGGMMMNFLISPGQDTVMLTRDLKEFVGGYAHHYSYDLEMMSLLLKKCGFDPIIRSDFCGSHIEELKEPYHIKGLDPKWEPLNQDFYKKHKLVHEYKDGKYTINFQTTGFDRDPHTSLIVEARKVKHVSKDQVEDLNASTAKNYNRYGFSLLNDSSIREKLQAWGVNVSYRPDLKK